MRKKFLVALALAGLLSLVACNNSDRARNNSDDREYAYNFDNAIRDRNGISPLNRNDTINNLNDTEDRNDNQWSALEENGEDRHYNFVSGLGFENVVNPNGNTYHERYRLDETSATDNNIFQAWRHTWVEPSGYLNKDIDVYRYTADFNGEPRIIHIKSYNGEVLGGYHFREGESVEQARMIDHNGYSSRLSNDFRGTWDDIFGI